MIRHRMAGALAAFAILASPVLSSAAVCPDAADDLNDTTENATADFGYYYTVTGGKNQNPGGLPNGDNASGGTFRFILDSPAWGRPRGVWTRDDWFVENAGLALTLVDGGDVVYDNNGIEDGTYGDFYKWASESDPPSPGLYRGYSMSNNFDWIYATVFVLDEPVTFDTAIGYFDGNGLGSAVLDPNDPGLGYRFNIWSAVVDGMSGSGQPHWMPSCEGFTGDVVATDVTPAVVEVSDTGVVREFPPGPTYGGLTDPIWRVTFSFPSDITLPAGVYVVSHDVTITPTVAIDVRPGSDRNQVNTNAKQLVPVAIFSTDDFDASAEIDQSSLDVRGATPSETRSTIEDVDGDGLNDLVVYVRARQIAKPTDSECAGGGKIRVTGHTTSGEPFAGADVVEFLGPDCN